VKRKALIRHLEAHDCTFLREGGNHSLYRHVATQKVSTVPRHTEINAELARKICKDLGIPAPAER
jgi:predicted RNA binding protein YcfA (HicA-like mRNA interferase family)